MVLLIIIPFLNGYFIGKINPTFSDKPISQWTEDKTSSGNQIVGNQIVGFLKIADQCGNMPISPTGVGGFPQQMELMF